jgi:subtilase family serine protease
MRRFHSARVLAATALIAFGLTSCGPHGTSPVPMTQAQTNPFNGDSAFLYNSTFLRESHYLKPAVFGTLGFDVIVRLQNPEGLIQYAKDASNAKSPTYRQFLTPEQVADRFMATTSDYAAATAYLKRYGLKVAGWSSRMILHVTGTQHQLESAFSTKFGWYKNRNETFLAPIMAPRVPKGVPIVGSLNIVYRTRDFQPSKITVSNGLTSGYSPQQMQLAFDYAGAYNVGYTGAGITIGVIGTGGVSINSTGHLGDLEAMRGIYGAQGANTITLEAVTGAGFATPPAVTKTTSSCNDTTPAGGDNPNLPPSESPTSTCNPEDGEAQIDTEQTALLSPGSAIQFYLGYQPSSTNPSDSGFSAQGLGGDLWIPELAQALQTNTADILSISFGGDEESFTPQLLASIQTLFAAAQSQGIAVFASSGDNGAYACQDGLGNGNPNDKCVSYPATDANVTAVGGVNTPLNGAGQLVGPITAWGETTSGGLGGTGGGVSSVVSMPKYEQLCGLPSGCEVMPGMTAGSCGSPPCRNVPDVSLEADPLTGVATVMNADPSIGPRQVVSFGGTSVAAPEMAAQWGLVLGVCKSKGLCGIKPPNGPAYRTGNAAALLYPLYYVVAGGKAIESPSYPITFYDVLFGSNGQCHQQPSGPSCPTPGPTGTPGPTFLPGNGTGVGYDQSTGLGVPFARALIKALSGV